MPRKHILGTSSDLAEEGMAQPQDNRDSWNWAEDSGRATDNPLLTGELQEVSNLWCRGTTRADELQSRAGHAEDGKHFTDATTAGCVSLWATGG